MTESTPLHGLAPERTQVPEVADLLGRS